MAKSELTIILPGLASIVGQRINVGTIPPTLSKMLNKARFQADSTGLARLLFNHFSQVPLTSSDLPSARLTASDPHVIKADPCYLHPDRDRLLLFADNLQISTEESIALIAEIQPLLDAFNGKLSALQPDSWLLTLPELPALTYTALPEANGKGLDTNLPQGADKNAWLCLWNEIQMQLYDAEVNQKRISAGKLPINSVWFWGAGDFIAKENGWREVRGNGLLLNQLTTQSRDLLRQEINWVLPTVTSFTSGKHLWVIDEFDLEGDWQQQLQHFDLNNLVPLWTQLKKSTISKITLQIPEHGHYQLTALDAWKFWKS